MVRIVARVLLIGPLMAAGPALAQSETNVLLSEEFREERAAITVTQRLNEEFRPVGGRLGAFIFFPQVISTVRVTDNVLATDSNKREDAFLDASAGFRMVRQGSADRMTMQFQIGQALHVRNDLEDSTRLLARMNYRLGPEDGSNLQLTGLASRQFIPRQDVNNVVEARSPIQLNIFGVGSGYQHVLGRTTLSIDASVFSYEYNDSRTRAGTVVNQDFRNNVRLLVGGAARYDLSTRFAGLVRGSYTHIEYGLDPGDRGFVAPFNVDRDSATWRVEGGIAFSADSSVSGSATVGYSQRRFSATVGRLPLDSGGLSFAADLAWNATPSTTLRINADRSFLESADPALFGFFATGGSVGIDHSPATAVLVKVRANVRDVNAIGGIGDRTDVGASGELTYYLSRRYRLVGSLSYTHREAEIRNDAFQEIFGQFGIIGSF